MAQDDVVQIRVGGQAVGIIGLKAAIEEVAETCRDRPEEEVQAELLRRLIKEELHP